MYSKSRIFFIRYRDIELDCDCQVSTTHYDKYTTSKEDVIQAIETVWHKGEAITDLLSEAQIDDIMELCYEDYYS